MNTVETINRKKIILIFFFASIFFLGIFVGIIIENIREGEQKKYTFQETIIPEKNIPIIEFSTIENGILYGNTKNGEIRVILKKEDITILPEGNFSLSLTPILPMLKTLPAPNGKFFVASSRGKKFYPLDNPNAFLITAKNRIFFSTEQEAIEKGFTRQSK